MRILTRSAPALAAALVATAALGVPEAQAQYRPVAPWTLGEAVSALKVTELNLASPGRTAVRDFDKLLGGRPAVVHFWMPGAKVPPGTFEDLYALGDAAKLRVVVVGVPRALMTAEEVAREALGLGLRAPVLYDDGYQLAQAMYAMTVPNLSVIDAGGVLRLRGAQSLLHPVEGATPFGEYVRAGAAAGRFATVRTLAPYQPVVEAIGKPYTDFSLPLYGGGQLKLSEFVRPGKVTAIFFWSPTCPHCKEALPSVNEARRKFGGRLNFVSVTQLPTPELRAACDEVVDKYKIDFPIGVDNEGEATTAYKVRGTPTTVFIGPDGIVGNCALYGDSDYVALVGAEVAKLDKR